MEFGTEVLTRLGAFEIFEQALAFMNGTLSHGGPFTSEMLPGIPEDTLQKLN